MKKNTYAIRHLFFCMALLFAQSVAQGQGFEKVFPNGPNGSFPGSGKDIIDTQDGNLLVLTDSSSLSVQLLMKLDLAGNTIWSQPLTTDLTVRGVSLVELPNGGFAVAGDREMAGGSGDRELYWQIRSAGGAFLEEHAYNDGVSNFSCTDAVLSPNANLILAGKKDNGGNGELLFIEFQPGGSLNWQHSLPSTFDTAPVKMAFLNNATGVVGYFDQTAQRVAVQTFLVDGTLSDNYVLDQLQGAFTDIVAAAGNGFFVGTIIDANNHTIFKFDDDGQQLWASGVLAVWGPLSDPRIAATTDGGCMATGYTIGQFLQLYRFDANGYHVWSKLWKDGPFNSGGAASAITATATGGYAFTGELFNPNNFTIAIDSNGVVNSHHVVGKLALDVNNNCVFDQPGDQFPTGLGLQFVGEDTFTTLINSLGGDFEAILDTGVYTVNLITPNSQLELQPCQPLPTFHLTTFYDTTSLGVLLFKPVQNASLSGITFHDANMNGQYSGNEMQLPCMDLHITCDYPFLDTIVRSSANSFYSLPVSMFATYKITPLTTYQNCQSSTNPFFVYVNEPSEVRHIGLFCSSFPVEPGVVHGRINFDLDGDCLPDSGNFPAGMSVQFQDGNGNDFFAYPNSQGYYSIGLPPGTYQATGNAGFGDWQICNATSPVTVNTQGCYTKDFVVQLPHCAIPYVDVAVNRFRACNLSTVVVKYCNLGPEPAYNASVLVILDPALIFESSSMPLMAQNGDTLWFNLGNIDPFVCATFVVKAKLGCTAIVGQTYCVEAHIFPELPCPTPNPNWDGSNIELSSRCENNSVTFTIKNTGLGDMATPIPYLVIEDNVLLRPDEIMAFQLPAGGDTSIVFPVQGQTLRLETHQPDGHPTGKKNAIWEEGCGANPANNFSRGFVTQYPYGDEEAFISVFCDESVGSYDPNIKKPFPKGIGPEHFIENTTELDYQILFQNTGTAPAFTVVLRDTLSPLLDPATLSPGASSHPYSFVLENGNVAVFTFDNINLPDSTSNLDGSIGFMKFHIAQTDGNLPGDVIENDAAIYFDFNDPVITPTVVHRIPLPVYTQTNAVTLCAGETWQGEVYTADAIVRDTVFYAFFDSVFITEIAVLPAANGQLQQTLCAGESLTVNGSVYNEANPSGTEVLQGASWQGCDSNLVVSLSFLPGANGILEQSLCPGESITVNGTVYDENHPNGTEILANSSWQGCDSTVSVSLSFWPTANGLFQQTLCPSESLIINGTAYDEANPTGVETFPNASWHGCDSTLAISLDFYETAVSTIAETLCTGGSLMVNGTLYDETNPSGTEILPNANWQGCDSIIHVSLSFLPAANGALEQTLCFGGSLSINGTVYDEANPTGTELLPNASWQGCDSTLSISLSFGNEVVSQLSPTLCPGESITVNGSIYDASNPQGSETFMEGSYLGCDSTVQVSLAFYPAAESEWVGPICEDESITINGTVYNGENPSGVEVLHNAAFNGCDSIIFVDLEFLANSFATFDTTLMAGEIWQGMPIWTDTMFTQTFPQSNGCDSIVEVVISILLDEVEERAAKAPHLSAYPNPANGKVTAELFLPKAGEVTLVLVSPLGQMVRTVLVQEMLSAGKYQISIEMDGLPDGLYCLWLSSADGQVVLKVVKKE
ncbi:MAG: T9SS type A sorting domain-containing protein [Lewinellaceae bacterium]|nr:T9SS type A sorting domain-containing protein [Saprospiraceae bacterium]MCB9340639.1 T9SS type A sorting domain-containing protein [Lewinellaceae bacterium]